MKKLLLAIMLALVVPQVALAAWWNPIDWFKNKEVKVPETSFELDDNQRLVEDAENLEPVEKNTNLESKIVKEVITVDNPELQKKIDLLVQENISLQTKLSSQSNLIQRLNACNADLSELKVSLGQSPISPEEREKIQKLESLDDTMESLVEETISDIENTKRGYGTWESVPSESVRSLRKKVATNLESIRGLIYSYDRIDPRHSTLSLEYQTDDLTKTLNQLKTLLKDLEFYIEYR